MIFRNILLKYFYVSIQMGAVRKLFHRVGELICSTSEEVNYAANFKSFRNVY